VRPVSTLINQSPVPVFVPEPPVVSSTPYTVTPVVTQPMVVATPSFSTSIQHPEVTSGPIEIPVVLPRGNTWENESKLIGAAIYLLLTALIFYSISNYVNIKPKSRHNKRRSKNT
jgi:hypothetical protein